MKKYAFLAGLVIAFIACNKSDDDVPAPTQTSSFSASIKEVFTDPHKDLKNLLVNDYIPYEITIEDSNSDTEGVSYSLISKKDENKHQILNRDFELYTDNEKGEKQKVTTDYISFSPKGKHKFYIKPIVPGTFQHTYTLQRQVNGKPEGGYQYYDINFNAVRITAWTHTEIYDRVFTGPFLVGHSKHWRRFEFKIEDGTNVNDKYLSPDPKKVSQIYVTLYNGQTYQGGVFEEGTNKFFSEETRTYDADPPFPSSTLSEVHIIQQYPNQDPYEIVYYNINIVEIFN